MHMGETNGRSGRKCPFEPGGFGHGSDQRIDLFRLVPQTSFVANLRVRFAEDHRGVIAVVDAAQGLDEQRPCFTATGGTAVDHNVRRRCQELFLRPRLWLNRDVLVGWWHVW